MAPVDPPQMGGVMAGLWAFLKMAPRVSETGVASCEVPKNLAEHLSAHLKEAMATTRYPFIRIVDNDGTKYGAYIDRDALNLLLKVQSLIENPDALARIINESDSEESDSVDADKLEEMLSGHAR